jgi:hypothetical protein
MAVRRNSCFLKAEGFFLVDALQRISDDINKRLREENPKSPFWFLWSGNVCRDLLMKGSFLVPKNTNIIMTSEASLLT